MDYGTFFFTNIVSVTVFALCVGVLAWHNRPIAGMKWFAGSLGLVLAKLILQGFEGKTHPILTAMLPNELYLISFVLQMIGLRWFLLRRPVRHRWPLLVVGILLAVYTTMFLGDVRYSSNLLNLPAVAVCAVSVWLLVKFGRAPVSRVAAILMVGETVVVAYRAVLTNLRYMRPWETVSAHSDPRWLYSLAAMALLTTCMAMCYLWYLVTELNRVLAEQARTDPLTGALNRRAIEEAARRETARSIRHGHPLSMIVIDVDHFKLLNDTRGHAAGDLVLRTLVDKVQAMLRTNDLLARTGGEEFTILLPDTAACSGVVAAERLRQALEAIEVRFESELIRFTISAGVAELDARQGDWESMMRRADSAMYEAKGHGRNSVFPDTNMVCPGAAACRLAPATFGCVPAA
jgi:diguanylate cyclase (GGDEF)-like protein